MTNRQSERFRWLPFLKAVAMIAIPVALQNLLTTTGSMVDTIMLASLGETVVGAVGLCAQFSSIYFSCYWGFIGGGMLFLAQYWGARNEDGLCRAFGTTLTLVSGVGLIFTGMALFAPELVMSVYTDKQEFQVIGVEYLRIVGYSYLMTVISVAVSSFLRSTERVRIPLIASVCSVLTNMVMNWILIYGKLGLPAMGVKGAALATVIAAAVNLTVMVLAARFTGFRYLFMFRKHFRFTRAWFGEYFRKCFPILMDELLIGVGFMLINVILGRQEAAVISALAVFRTFEGFIISFFSGFSNAASVLIGNFVGSGQLKKAYQSAKRLILLCAAAIFLCCLLVLCVHKPLFTLMSLSGDSYDVCYVMLLVYAFAAVIRMCNWTQNDTFRSGGDAAYATVLEIVFMYAVVLPCVFLSGIVFHLPYVFVFIACYIDEPIRFILMQVHMYSGKWIKPVTPEGRDALPEFRASLKK